MFSAAGSKKVMLDNLRKSRSSGKEVFQLMQAKSSKVPAPSVLFLEELEPTATNKPPPSSSSPSKSLISAKSTKSTKKKITTETLQRDLTRSDVHGTAVNKIASALAEFRMDRDGILLEGFKVRSIDYAAFRMLLKRGFTINFTDEEFEYICELFDENGDGDIDGTEFLVAMRLITSAWKSRQQQIARKKEMQYQLTQKELEEKAKAEREAELEAECDWDHNEEDELSALDKLTDAAGKYIKTDPTAPSLAAFEVKYLKPAAFRVLMRNTFAINLTRQELGSMVRMFDIDGSGLVDTTTFLLKFSRLGLEYRNNKRLKQIEMTARAEQEAIAYQERLLQQARDSIERVYDSDFDESDKESALRKLVKAAKGYRKHGGSGLGLEAFNGVKITAGLFREMVKRIFNVNLSGKELGAVVQMFDKDGSGDVNCQAFLVFFTNAGFTERSKDHSDSLNRRRQESQERAKKELELAGAAAKKNLLNESLLQGFTEDDTKSALDKFRVASRHYAGNVCNFPGALDAFSVASMLPGVFQEKCSRGLGVFLTNLELGAMVAMFDLNGDRKLVDCPAFSRHFKRLGFEEKEKLWAAERDSRNKSLKLKKEHAQKVKDEFAKKVESGAIDFDFSEEDLINGTKKMKFAASHADPSNPESVGLSAFSVNSLTPGQLREKLVRVLGVHLTPRELGAVMKPFLKSDGSGDIDCTSLKAYILALSKDVREEIRQKRIITERAEREKNEKILAQMAAERLQHEIAALQHSETDEETLMKKLNNAAQSFAVDNASYLRTMDPLKAPSISPTVFIDVFFRVFQLRLSMSEVGLLIKTVNPIAAKHRVVDGVSFLKGFYKLSRLQHLVLLGKLNPEHIHINVLYPDEPIAAIVAAGTAPKQSTSRKKSHWSVDQLTMDTKRDQLEHIKVHPKPMLPSLLDGSNPWYDWGLAESGYLSILSNRPSSSRRGRTSRPSSAVDGDSPHRPRSRSRSQSRSRSPSPSFSRGLSRPSSPDKMISTPAADNLDHTSETMSMSPFQPSVGFASSQDVEMNTLSASGSQIHLESEHLLPSTSIIRPQTAGPRVGEEEKLSLPHANARPGSAPVNLRSVTIDSPSWRMLHVGGTHAGVDDREILVAESIAHGGTGEDIPDPAVSLLGHSVDRTATVVHAAKTLEIAKSRYGNKITRSSLPATFSAVGIARQLERHKLLGNSKS